MFFVDFLMTLKVFGKKIKKFSSSFGFFTKSFGFFMFMVLAGRSMKELDLNPLPNPWPNPCPKMQ